MGIYTLPLVSLVVAQVQHDDAFAAAKSGDLYNLRKLRQANWKENKPTATDGWKKTALHYAAEYDHADVADTMIGNAEVMAMKDYKGRTPLSLQHKRAMPKLFAIWQNNVKTTPVAIPLMIESETLFTMLPIMANFTSLEHSLVFSIPQIRMTKAGPRLCSQ